MRYAVIPLLLSIMLIGCSSTCTLQMAPDADLSMLSQDASCWLGEVEDVCISLSANKSFTDTEQLEQDIKSVACLLMEMDGGEAGWYAMMSETQRDRVHELLLAMAIHYGVRHFVDV